MKVFLSWSGPTSGALARALREWLPLVIQAVKPWMSERDIGPGERWGTEVAAELAETKFGIICLTPDNLTEPWILFESGALSKTVESTYVCPYLFRVPVAALQYPLAQFQAVLADEAGSWSIIQGINRALGDRRLPEETLKVTFDGWWPRLRTALDEIPQQTQGAMPLRSEREMLEEILQLVRGFVRRAQEESRAQQLDRLSARIAAFADPSLPLASLGGFEGLGLGAALRRRVGGRKVGDALQNLGPPDVEEDLPEPEPLEREEPESQPPEPES